MYIPVFIILLATIAIAFVLTQKPRRVVIVNNPFPSNQPVSSQSKQEPPPPSEPKTDVPDDFAGFNLTPIDLAYQRDRIAFEYPLVPLASRPPNESCYYQMLGYLVGDESDEIWQLYGRERLPNQGEFYVKPVDRNLDISIPLTPDMMPNSRKRLRNLYDLPERTVIDHPIFNAQSYRVATHPYGIW